MSDDRGPQTLGRQRTYSEIRHHCTAMSSFSAPNAFADPEDSKLVADAKQQPTESLTYSYTEVALSF